MGKGQSLGELCVCAWSEVEGRAACAGLFGARLLASTWLHMAGRPRYASLSQSFAVALCRLLLLQSLATPRAPAHKATAQPCISTVARCVNPPRSREHGENAGGGAERVAGRCHRVSPAWLPDNLVPALRHGVRPASGGYDFWEAEERGGLEGRASQ